MYPVDTGSPQHTFLIQKSPWWTLLKYAFTIITLCIDSPAHQNNDCTKTPLALAQGSVRPEVRHCFPSSFCFLRLFPSSAIYIHNCLPPKPLSASKASSFCLWCMEHGNRRMTSHSWLGQTDSWAYFNTQTHTHLQTHTHTLTCHCRRDKNEEMMNLPE